MSLKFNQQYIEMSKHSVAMVVVNGVTNDSRVLKTAGSLSKFGLKVEVFGIGNVETPLSVEGFPFAITLLPNPAIRMRKAGQWLDGNGNENVSLFITELALAFFREISKKRVTFLHTHDMYGLAVGARIRDMSDRNLSWFHDIHEYVEGCTHIKELIRKTLWEEERAHIAKPDALTTVSPILADIIAAEYGVRRPGLILNAPRAADYDQYYPRPIRDALGLNDGSPLVIYNGNVKPIRGVHFVLEALRALPRMHFALVTDSKNKYVEELQDNARKWGLRERFHIHPYVPHYEVTSFIAGASVGVNPLTIYGNSDLAFPNKLFEYLHARLPIVSSETTAAKSFITTHKCGLTFAGGDVQGLAECLDEALSRFPRGLDELSNLPELLHEYSWEKQEETLYSLYLARIGSHSRATRTSQWQPVLQLPTHAANQPYTLARALQQGGVDCRSGALGRNRFTYETDIELADPNNSLATFQQHLQDTDFLSFNTYHYHVRPLLFDKHFAFPTGLDLLMLKAMGKKVLFHFRGSEGRLPSIFRQRSPYNYWEEQKDNTDKAMPYAFNEQSQRAFMAYVRGVCDEVLVNDPEMQCYAPNSRIVPRAISLADLDTEPLSRCPDQPPLVLHAPSRGGVKGTRYILDAVTKLKAEGLKFDFKLVENLPHDEAMSLYRKADIIVDQLRIGWYGMLAVEGMAMGKAVVSYVRNDLRHYLPNPAPLAIASPDSVIHVLRDLIQNKDLVEQLGERGRRFVLEHHDSSVVANTLMRLYESELKPVDPLAVTEFMTFQRKPHRTNVVKRFSKLSKIFNLITRENIREFAKVSKTEGLIVAINKTLGVVKLHS